MLRLNYFSLRRLSGRIFFGFMLVSLLALISGSISYILLSQTARDNTLNNRLLGEYTNTVSFENMTDSLEETVSDIIFNGKSDLQDYYKTNHMKAASDLFLVEELIKQDRDAQVSALFEKLKANYTTVETDYATVLAANKPLLERQNYYNQAGAKRDELRDSLKDFITDRQANLNKNQQEGNSFILITRWTNLVLALFSFALAIILAILLTRGFVRPINQLIEKLRRVANGDLTEQLQARGNDEVTELSVIFNRSIASLKLTIARIQEQANKISATSRQINSSSVSQTNSLAEQAVAVTQVSATVEELSGTSQQIAESANRVATSATSALSSAEKGFETMEATDQIMREIRTKVNQIADRILALNSTAQRIRDITKLIDNIANETHLLALNAAIESAGAGAEGQRFGVVASSVRKLAQRSRVATVEIQQLVSQIQIAAGASVMATEEGMKTVALGEEMLEQSLEAQQDIIEQTMKTNELANAISLATDQQRLASSQVAATIRELSRIINDISVGSQQYRISVVDLSNVVVQINTLANAFVLEKEGSYLATITPKQAKNPEDGDNSTEIRTEMLPNPDLAPKNLATSNFNL
jgi:methyl-accepting chemotaxis protein